jgi:hypothetical protein
LLLARDVVAKQTNRTIVIRLALNQSRFCFFQIGLSGDKIRLRVLQVGLCL